MSKQLSKNKKGFTIIEVLIVLAIAGLIMLVVFLAVPALQRNSRNTSRKADVSAVLAAVNEYTSNNNGSLPSAAPTWAAPTLTLKGGASAITADAKLGFYTGGIGTGNGQVTEITTPAVQSALAGDSANDRVVIVNGSKCGAAGATALASPRQVAVQYEIETGSGSYSAVCQDS